MEKCREIKDKPKYLEEIRRNIQQYQAGQEQLFEEMCKQLKVSKEDKEIFFDYCYNNHKFEYGMEVLKSYLK